MDLKLNCVRIQVAGELRRGYASRPHATLKFNWHCIGNQGLRQVLSRTSCNLHHCYKLQLLIMFRYAINYPFLTELESPLCRLYQHIQRTVSASPVSSVVLTVSHGECLEMQIFPSAILHVGPIDNKICCRKAGKNQ